MEKLVVDEIFEFTNSSDVFNIIEKQFKKSEKEKQQLKHSRNKLERELAGLEKALYLLEKDRYVRQTIAAKQLPEKTKNLLKELSI